MTNWLTTHALDPDRLSLPALAARCVEESKRFLKHEPTDSRYELELFRRAVALQNEDAWAYLYQQYAPMVLTWITQRIPGSEEEYAELVNAAFARFAQAVTPAKFAHFGHVAALLKYLKMCVHSVVADEVRARRHRPSEESIEHMDTELGTADDPADGVIAEIAAQGLWKVIRSKLHSEDELALILASMRGYHPMEIWQLHRDLFETVADVYRIKRNMMERFRRKRHLFHSSWEQPGER